MTLMKAPDKGVAVRMYRHGHGDCFLLAFPREGGGDPVYVMIDCGYKPGSQSFLSHGKKIGDVVEHIAEATGSRLDLVVITHEHQDHVNGIWKKRSPYFKDFTIHRAWFAWTEDPNDDLANQLRVKHRDQLLSLTAARRQLALAVGEASPAVRRIDALLSLELGEDVSGGVESAFAAASDPTKSTNKQAMKLVKDKAREKEGISYLSPGGEPVDVPDAGGARAYVLGPPRDEDLLTDEDPVGDEGFPDGSHRLSFGASVNSPPFEGSVESAPFRSRYCVPLQQAPAYVARGRDDSLGQFFADYYGDPGTPADDDVGHEAPNNATWRRIDADWLGSAEGLALKLNRGINNTSLVLAFELPNTKKVLLFVGDAQRGNWVTWADHSWSADGEHVTARDLLARAVLYKCGHHGSHNATLAGDDSDEYANLGWMGLGDAADEFTSMITAVNEWAMTKNSPPWRHPLKAIREALDKKCRGRVFQTDAEPSKPEGVSDDDWEAFAANTTVDELYFEYVITDD